MRHDAENAIDEAWAPDRYDPRPRFHELEVTDVPAAGGGPRVLFLRGWEYAVIAFGERGAPYPDAIVHISTFGDVDSVSRVTAGRREIINDTVWFPRAECALDGAAPGLAFGIARGHLRGPLDFGGYDGLRPAHAAALQRVAGAETAGQS